MIKKISFKSLAVMIGILTMVGSMTSCNNSTPITSTDNQKNQTPTTTIETTQGTETTELDISSINMENAQVIYQDDDGLKISYLAYEETSTSYSDGNVIKLLIENGSNNNYAIYSKDASVNNYVIDTSLLPFEVSSGETIISELKFNYLGKIGLDNKSPDVGEVKFNFRIHNTEDKNLLNDIISDTITLNIGQPVEPDLPQGEVIFDDYGIKVTYLENTSNTYSMKLSFLVENNSDKSITISPRNLSINGKQLDKDYIGGYITNGTLKSGQKSVHDLDVGSYELKMIKGLLDSISKEVTVENVEFNLHILDVDDYNNYIDSDPINITLPEPITLKLT